MIHLTNQTPLEIQLNEQSDKILFDSAFTKEYRKIVNDVSQPILSEALKRAEEKLERNIGYYHGRFYGVIQLWTLEFIEIVKKEYQKQAELQKVEDENEQERLKQQQILEEKKKREPKGLKGYF